MAQDNICKFCQGPVREGEVCSWCNFAPRGKPHIPGTLTYATQVGSYVLGDILTMNGESTTYEAYDRNSRRKVVVKEFLPVSMVAPRSGDHVEVQQGKEVLFKNLMMDFKDMYTVLKKIDSKAIQKVLNIFDANGTAYVVLEHIKGDSLKKNLIKRGRPYTFKEARWLFRDLFSLMDTLEKLNIAHGGISDETVMITPDNSAVLTDFTIRDLRVKNEHIMYQLYEGFSAPEQYNSGRFPGLYTDIYSMGALFYYAVTGRVFSDSETTFKDLGRLMPKCAVDALRYATKRRPGERIDNISDFVLMLDNKATVQKPPKKPAAGSIMDKLMSDEVKKYLPYGVCAVLVVLFAVAVFTIGSKGDSSIIPSTSMHMPEIISVPDLKGKRYSDIMKDEELNTYFYFRVSEEYSDIYNPGEVISQQPQKNEQVSRGTIIYLTVSKGPRRTTVPDGLVGARIENVKLILEDAGILYNIVQVAQTEEFRTGIVTGTDKAAGTVLKSGDILTVYVANDAPLPTPTPSPSPSPTPTPTPTPTPMPTPTPASSSSSENSSSAVSSSSSRESSEGESTEG